MTLNIHKYKTNKLINLNGISLDRQSALNRCLDLSEKFIEHFDKIFNSDNNETKEHWSSEMQAWLDSILKITLKPKAKSLSLQQKMD